MQTFTYVKKYSERNIIIMDALVKKICTRHGILFYVLLSIDQNMKFYFLATT